MCEISDILAFWFWSNNNKTKQKCWQMCDKEKNLWNVNFTACKVNKTNNLLFLSFVICHLSDNFFLFFLCCVVLKSSNVGRELRIENVQNKLMDFHWNVQHCLAIMWLLLSYYPRETLFFATNCTYEYNFEVVAICRLCVPWFVSLFIFYLFVNCMFLCLCLCFCLCLCVN